MVAAANFPVNYGATTKGTRIHHIEPIKTFAGAPPSAYQPAATGFAGQLNGVNQMVCMYLPSRLLLTACVRLIPDDRQLGRCPTLRGLLSGDAAPYGLLERTLVRTDLHLLRVHFLRRLCESISRKSEQVKSNHKFPVQVYSFYGQYAAQVITTAITPFSLQTVGNVFSLMTGAIACSKCRPKSSFHELI